MTLDHQSYSSRFIGQIDDLFVKEIVLPELCLRRSYGENEIRDIMDSIEINGLFQPIIVRPKDDSFFEIVAGCRRYLSCKALGWKKIPCHIVHLNDKQTFEVSLSENINRRSISPLEEAIAFKKYVYDNGWGSIRELSTKIGKSPSYITKRIGLLDLPQDIREKIGNTVIPPSTAEELFVLKSPEKQSKLADLISKQHLSIKQVRERIRDDPYYCENSEIVDVRSELQSFNKAVVALRIALKRLAETIEEENEDNIFIREFLLYQTKALHDQIDCILRAKKKYAKNIYKFRKMLK